MNERKLMRQDGLQNCLLSCQQLLIRYCVATVTCQLSNVLKVVQNLAMTFKKGHTKDS